MNVYFDTEFTGLYKQCELISIGLISEDGKEFYAEVSDLNSEDMDAWIKDNVLSNTINYGNVPVTNIVNNELDFVSFSNMLQLKDALLKWLSQFEDVQLISDVCHYDMVLFIDIFGSAFDLPDNVLPYCHDINQDIASQYWITDNEAFDTSREQLAESYGVEINGAKHNALYDAKVIKAIYENMLGAK